jgi:predicted nucleotidyltransferase
MISLLSWQAQSADRELLKQCKQAIQSVESQAKVVLYGSRARGEAAEDSDYDILVLTDQPVNMTLRENFIESIYPLELDTGAVITLIAYNRDQWDSPLYRAMPFHKNVDRDGVTL